MKKLFLILVLLTTAIYSKAQSDAKKKYVKEFEKAQEYYSRRMIKETVEVLNNLIKEAPDYGDPYAFLGYMYFQMGQLEPAYGLYIKALELNPDLPLYDYDIAAQLAFNVGEYQKAKELFEEVSLRGNKEKQEAAALFIKKCAFAIELVENPVPFKPRNLGPNVNSGFRQYFAQTTVDESTLIFTRMVPDERSFQEDFYICYKKDGAWTMARSLGPSVNTPDNEGAHCITPEGGLIFFTICESSSLPNYGACDLYMTKREGDRWLEPKNMGPVVNSAKKESTPTAAADGRTIYFASARPGGHGGMDIWKTWWTGTEWAKPENLGPTINTKGNELSPFIHPDNKTLYFASDYHFGLGKADYFVSRLDENEAWGEPKNLGFPINTSGHEEGIFITANGKKALISQEIPGQNGKVDIFEFDLYEEARANPVSYVKGNIYDDETKKPLEGLFQLIDLKTEKVVVESYSDKITGEFIVCLPSGYDYALNVSKDGYLFHSENFSLKERPATDPFKLDVYLKPIREDKTVVLRNVFFEVDSYVLKEESKAELNKLVSFLEKNSSLKIEIGGHTDNTGSAEHNTELSHNRAKSVYEYLINNGISSDRLSYAGYGPDVPIATNDTEEGRAQNRRTEFKIIGR